MKIIDQSARMLDPVTMEEGIAALKRCEYAGRTCYNSVDKITDSSYERFLRNVIKRGHTSVIEHDKVTLEIITGRDVLPEITRHRLCSFSVQSQRYVNADSEEGIAFIRPDFYIAPEDEKVNAKLWCASRCWEMAMEDAEERYRYLVGTCDMPPEDARKVLPNSTATQFVVTMNFRELLHVIELRTSVRAYPEMRTMMDKVIAALKEVLPPIWEWAKEDAQC